MKNVIFVLILSACARLSSLPPSPEIGQKLVNNQLDRPLKLEEVWFSKYTNALELRKQNKYAQACGELEYFKETEEFPLVSLAHLYRIDSCARISKIFPQVDVDQLEQSIQAGFQKEFYETIFNLAKTIASSEVVVGYALKLSPFKSLRAEKEELLLLANKLDSNPDLKKQAQDKLFKYSPRFNTSPTADLYPDIARDFEKARDFDQAIIWYKKILKEKPLKDFSRWISAANRYRQLFKNRRDKTGHLRETNILKKKLQRLVHKNKDDKIIDALADIMVQEARAQWTENNRTVANSILKQAQEFLPTMSQNMKALISWIRGMIELEAKNHGEAKILFKDAIAFEPTQQKILDDASWNLAWTLYLDGDFDEFIAFVNLRRSKLSEDLYEKLTFWQGKALYKQGRIPEALETWQELYKKSPYNFYGLMAHVSSGASFESISASLDETPKSAEVEWLASVGQFELCKDFLDDWRSNKISNSDKKEWLYSFIKCHHAAGAIRIYYSHPKARDIEFMTENLAALYPLSFKTDVFKAAEHFSIDPYLMQSIIRQESAFNPEARSPADAFGLMQLIPELALRLSKQYKTEYKSFDDLYDPAKNVYLGAAYLKELNSKMNKRMVGVIAAYNAGTGPIQNWYRVRNRKDVFEFIEGIAYEETRNYVKLVLRNWIIYQQIEKSSDFKLDLGDLH